MVTILCMLQIVYDSEDLLGIQSGFAVSFINEITVFKSGISSIIEE